MSHLHTNTNRLHSEAPVLQPSLAPGSSQSPLADPPRYRGIGSHPASIAILTGGGDKPYALGIAAALSGQQVAFDFIASDDLAVPEVTRNPFANVLNLRGDQRPNVGAGKKLLRVLLYYVRLIAYAFRTRARVFHLLWNNKFEWFDRTFLLLYYRLLGKKLVFTAHNVNAGKRDGNDSWLNRFTLGVQYRLVHHIFVHTDRMRQELLTDFSVAEEKVTVIPFGINNTLPDSGLTTSEARQRLGLPPADKVILFFGNILPYKGLEYLVDAVSELHRRGTRARLLIVGRVKAGDPYWNAVEEKINGSPAQEYFHKYCRFVPDEEVEVYTKAADVLVLPYTHIFQSGVLFVGYAFGLPVIAADVGSLKEEIVEGHTGYTFKPRNVPDLADKLQGYFSTELYANLDKNRTTIKAYANDRFSWEKVAKITTGVYAQLLSLDPSGR